MNGESLEAAIRRVGDPVELLRSSPVRPHTFPVAAEFSNWRSEQRAWRSSCALLDQSHHMTDLFVSGPDALALFERLGVNRFSGFGVDRAKQFVAVGPDGYLIGDAILFRLGDDELDLVGHPMAIDWVQFHAETGGWRVDVERDENSLVRRGGPPRLYRYELQGPATVALLEAVTGGALPEVGFFKMTRFTIANRQVRALRHGMAGQPGFELFGPFAEGEAVRDALLAAGERVGLVPAGAKAYSTANLESGWVPSPLPAIFTGEELQAYREWLPATSMGSLGGSFVSLDVRDYYLSPYELGYGRSIAFDHDFVGRPALEAMAERPTRTKVTLVWDEQDVAGIFASLLGGGTPAKYLDLPKARYALYQADEVRRGGERVGISTDCGYLVNEAAVVSLAVVDPSCAKVGTEVSLLWGERPCSRKPQVEKHEQVEIRARVAPAPFARFAREGYRRS